MKKIILLRGIPASGKSTWAKKMVQDNPGMYKRVNKDDLRAMLDASKWSKSNEQFVLDVRDAIVGHALEHGKHVIVDDTNLHQKHKERMEAIAKVVGSTVVEVKEFHVDLEEAIERDLKRPNSVGEKVIRRMYKQMNPDNREKYVPDQGKPKAVIFDVDGTLALMQDRSPYEWDKVHTDVPNKVVCHLAVAYRDLGYKLIIFTGRDGVCEDTTKKWLLDNQLHRHYFDIRPEGDCRKDCIVKKEMFDRIKDDYNIVAVFDDRNQVVEMRRSLGLTCFQVADGDF